MAKAKPRLGRGLSSLMKQPVPVAAPEHAELRGQAPQQSADATPKTEDQPRNQPRPQTSPSKAPASAPAEQATRADGLADIPVSEIRANPHQPRQTFNDDALKGLAASITRDGVMQPIIVRPLDPPAGNIRYELVAGERRWRAAQLAGLATIPSLVRDLDEHQAAQWALVENLQREDLDPIERAEAFQHLLDRFDLSHEQIADEVGVNRSTITNALRLLNLDPEVQQLIRQGLLSNGHAKVLAGMTDPQTQRTFAMLAVKKGWSVRRLEEEARNAAAPAEAAPSKAGAQRTSHLSDLEKQISTQLNTKVQIKPGRKKNSGAMVIEFYSLDEFDSLLSRLGVQANID